MSGAKKMERAPGFLFFPEKHLAHTRRLSDTAYRVYFDLLCALWMQAPDHCSVEATPEAVSVLIAADVERVRAALAEIQNPHAPLLKRESDRLVSNGLRKEVRKQKDRRESAARAAAKRWQERHEEVGMRSHAKTYANASIAHCIPIPDPPPTPSEHTHTAGSDDEGVLAMVRQIRACRPEYGRLREIDLANALGACPRQQRARLESTVARWCADQANALKAMDVPLASLRKAVAEAAGQAARGSSRKTERDERYEESVAKARG